MTKEEFFSKKIKEISTGQIVVDIGGGGGFSKQLAGHRHLFTNNYKTIDIDAKTQPDIVGDIHHLPFQDESIDGVICISVLEHVENPERAVYEINRVLKKNGKFFAYVPFLFPYHAKGGHYQDFFRFTRDGINYLLRDFNSVELMPTRHFFEMWFLMLPKIGPILAHFGRLLDKFIPSGENQVSGFLIYAVK